ncbi:MAG: amidohydrolase family protein [Planctomycetes bacterium]|nr:amidohydrolase family protein [Planctomycetota bacterium]
MRLTTLFSITLLSLSASAQTEHAYETQAMREPTLSTGGSCVIRDVVIHTATQPAFRGDVLVLDGMLAQVGEVSAPPGIVELDGAGRHLAPGVVDCHSHMAIARGINESTVTISCDCDISDVVDPDDMTIYRALAGGATTARLLHGSANAIGGLHEVIQLKWGRTADELRFPEAREGVKFALGENPKRSNSSRRGSRFPSTRLGVAAVYQRAFPRAAEYQLEWDRYEAEVRAGVDPAPPREDIRLNALSGILSGEIPVHSHCYRADGILMLMRASEQFGFKILTLQHVLEGYKVAKEMAELGVAGSTFGDWWSYKLEAFDAIPQNAALMDEAGILSSINSDDDEMVRRMYVEAAKSVRYAGMDRVRALGLVTLFPAQQLEIGDQTGSIEAGKRADLTLLTGDPLSSLSRVEWTMVEGEIEFERRDTFGFDAEPLEPRAWSEPKEGLPVNPEGGEVVAIAGAKIHPVSAAPIENGTILIQDGRILALGSDLAVPSGARVISEEGLEVWPGLIAINTAIGLREIAAVRSTMDTDEIGEDHPDLVTSTSLNAESAHIAVTRTNGVTRAQVAPRGRGTMNGKSSVVRMVGATWEELLYQDEDMLHLGFPMVRNSSKKKEEPEAVGRMRELFTDALEYGRLVDESREAGVPGPPFDPRLESLVPFARGEARVAVHADNAQTILFALRFIGELGLDAVLFGVTEGWKVADAIARADVPVVVGPILELPSTEYDPYDAPFANPAVLMRAGVRIAIQTSDDENPRNVAFHAAMAAAYGLPREEAVRAITLGAAEALGIDDELGSLEPGKIADLVITRGDLMEVADPVRYVFIDGVQVSLENRQSRFYEKYRERLMQDASSGQPSADR